ncbi:MAG: DASS family sodium-coupled anion symporter [Pseudomonadota bacterium]
MNEKKWLFITALFGAVFLSLPTPEGLTREGHIVLAMTIMAVILFIAEPIPLPAVALLIIVGQVYLLKIDSNIVARSLMSDSVLFIMGSLMLAVAIVKQRLDKRIAYLIVRLTGPKPANVSVGIILISGILASIIGEHTVAAMMLPVALTLVSLVSSDKSEVRSLAAVLLFSIAYGCSIASIGTPSGGARNAIMIGYWREFFYDPLNPETSKFLIGYVKWALYCYPLFLIQAPFVAFLLLRIFKPKQGNISRAIVRLRMQIAEQGSMTARDWLSILGFFLTLLGWIFLSDKFGLGVIAICGALFFLIAGLVRWNDLNSGVNWGVVLLYAAAISLGVQMKDTGAAQWAADSFLQALSTVGVDKGFGLWAATSILTTFVTNTMSNGAAVAVLGPITLNLAGMAGESAIRMGFITAVSSSFAYLTVVGTPAATIVYSSGFLTPRDFLRAGSLMALISTTVLLLAALAYWPLLGL